MPVYHLMKPGDALPLLQDTNLSSIAMAAAKRMTEYPELRELEIHEWSVERLNGADANVARLINTYQRPGAGQPWIVLGRDGMPIRKTGGIARPRPVHPTRNRRRALR